MRRFLTTFLCLLFMVFHSLGCGWDWDTIQMEKQAFPSVHELITGKFLRHSEQFYYWRVRDREEKLIIHPDSINLYDDLAWALDKTGDHDEAIEILTLKDSLFPGLYETYANLGTVYIHNGELEKGAKYIGKAIEINPEAHFGREIYQLHLVRYVLSKQVDGNTSLPLSISSEPDFYSYLKEHEFSNNIGNGSTHEKEIAKAIYGISGMMKFGNYNSPVLLEALGDLLYAANSGRYKGAGHLAARAYMKASFLIKDEEISKLYRDKAQQSLEYIYAEYERNNLYTEGPVYTIKQLENALRLEIIAGEKWFDEIAQNELEWIESGINPDSAFAANYYEDPIAESVKERTATLDKEDAQYWLNWQQKQPINFGSLASNSSLTLQEKAKLDSLYDSEFRTIFVEEPSEIDRSLKKAKSNNEETGSRRSLIVTLIVCGILMVVFLLLRFKSNRRGGRRRR